MKYLKNFNQHKAILEDLDLSKFYSEHKINPRIQFLSQQYVNEKLSTDAIPRDISKSKNKVIFWVAKSFKQHLLSEQILNTEKVDNIFKKYVSGEEKVDNKKSVDYFIRTIDSTFKDVKEKYDQIFDYFLSSGRTNKLNLVSSTLQDMYEEQEEWHDNLQVVDDLVIKDDGKILKTFSDGYYWIDIEKQYSPEEQKAMGHCGRTSADTMLSLRKNGKPHITIAVDYLDKKSHTYKSIRQCKGKQNKKPIPQYHKYIIGLLLDEKFKNAKINNDEYNAKEDFHIFDIKDDSLFKTLIRKRKDLFERVPLILFNNIDIDLILEEFSEILEKPSVFDYLFLKKKGYFEGKSLESFSNYFEYKNEYYLLDEYILKGLYKVDMDKIRESLIDKSSKDIQSGDISKFTSKIGVYNIDVEFLRNNLIPKNQSFFNNPSNLSNNEKAFLYDNELRSVKDFSDVKIMGSWYSVEEDSINGFDFYKIQKISDNYATYYTITIEELIGEGEEGIKVIKELNSSFEFFDETESIEDARLLNKIGIISDEHLEEVESFYQEFIDNNPKIAVFGNWYKDEHDSEFRDWMTVTSTYDNETFKPDDSQYGEEYLVLTDDEADTRSYEYAQSLIDEVGVPENLLMQFVDGSAILDWIRDDYDEVVREEPENWDVEKEISDEGRERIAEIKREFEDLKRVEEEEDVEEQMDELQTELQEIIDLEHHDSDYYEYTEEKIEEKIDELVDQYNTDPIDRIKEMFGDGKELVEFIKNQGWVDEDKVVKHKVETDGRGVQLSGYDHQEHEYEWEGETYYIYRTN